MPEPLLDWLSNNLGNLPSKSKYANDLELKAAILMTRKYGTKQNFIITLKNIATSLPAEHRVAQIYSHLTITLSGIYIPPRVLQWLENHPAQIPRHALPKGESDIRNERIIASDINNSFGKMSVFMGILKREAKSNPNSRIAKIYKRFEENKTGPLQIYFNRIIEWMKNNPGYLPMENDDPSRIEENRVENMLRKRFKSNKDFLSKLAEAAKNNTGSDYELVYSRLTILADGSYVDPRVIKWMETNDGTIPGTNAKWADLNSEEATAANLVRVYIGTRIKFRNLLDVFENDHPENTLAKAYSLRKPSIHPEILQWLVEHPGQLPQSDSKRIMNLIYNQYRSLQDLVDQLKVFADKYPEHEIAMIYSRLPLTKSGRYIPPEVIIWMEKYPGKLPLNRLPDGFTDTRNEKKIAAKIISLFGNISNFIEVLKQEYTNNPDSRIARLYAEFDTTNAEMHFNLIIEWMKNKPGYLPRCSKDNKLERSTYEQIKSYFKSPKEFLLFLSKKAKENPGTDIEAVYKRLTILPDGSYVDPFLIDWMNKNPGRIPSPRGKKNPSRDEIHAAALLSRDIGTVDRFQDLMTVFVNENPNHTLSKSYEHIEKIDSLALARQILTDDNYPKPLRAALKAQLQAAGRGKNRIAMIEQIDKHACVIDHVEHLKDKMLIEISDLSRLSDLRKRMLSEQVIGIFEKFNQSLSSPMSVPALEYIEREATNIHDQFVEWLWDSAFSYSLSGYYFIPESNDDDWAPVARREKNAAKRELNKRLADLPEHQATRVRTYFNEYRIKLGANDDWSEALFDAELMARTYRESNRLRITDLMMDVPASAQGTLAAFKIAALKYIEKNFGKIRYTEEDSGVYLRKLQDIVVNINQAATPEMISDQLLFAQAIKDRTNELEKKLTSPEVYELFRCVRSIREANFLFTQLGSN